MVLALACSSEPTQPLLDTSFPTPEVPNIDELKGVVVSHYADGVHTLYTKSLASPTAVDAALTHSCPTPLPLDERTEVFGSGRLLGALLDHLTQDVHILEMNGETYRLKRSRGNATSLSADAPDDA